jgi:hypothetical protein
MENEYEKYLDRLNHLIYSELVPKTAVFDYFTEHLYKVDENPYEVEPMLWFIQSALYSDITFSIFRLFDKNGDRNIFHFLNYTEQHLHSIAWKTPLSLTEINEQRAALSAVTTQIENLRKRRNKFFGHYDKKFFYEPQKIDDDFPFSNEDAKILVRVLQRIISGHMRAFHGRGSLSLEGFIYVAAEKLYEAMRKNQPS